MIPVNKQKVCLNVIAFQKLECPFHASSENSTVLVTCEIYCDWAIKLFFATILLPAWHTSSLLKFCNYSMISCPRLLSLLDIGLGYALYTDMLQFFLIEFQGAVVILNKLIGWIYSCCNVMISAQFFICFIPKWHFISLCLLLCVTVH